MRTVSAGLAWGVFWQLGRCHCAGQARGKETGGSDRKLRLVGSCSAKRGCKLCCFLVRFCKSLWQVDQRKASRVLRLSAAHKSPERRERKVRALAGFCCHSSASENHQLGLRRTLRFQASP